MRTHFQRPAKKLEVGVAAIAVFMLAVVMVRYSLFQKASRDNQAETRGFVLANQVELDGGRLAIQLTNKLSTDSPADFIQDKATFRSGLNAFESASSELTSAHNVFVRAEWSQAQAKFMRALRQVAEAQSPAEVGAISPSAAMAQSQYDEAMRSAVKTMAGDLNTTSSRRLWVFGSVLPNATFFTAVAIAGFCVRPWLRKLNTVNATLIELQSAAEQQAAKLEEQNTALHAQQTALREHQAELILKSEQLEAISFGSQQAARRFEELFQGLPVACVGFSNEGRIFEWNRASSDLFGYDAYQVLHEQLWANIADASFKRRGSAIVKQVFNGREYKNVEWVYTRPDGSVRNVLAHLFPLRGLDGRILGGVVACSDVTSAKHAAEKLRDSEKLFRDLIDSLHEGVLLYDRSGQIVVSNRQAIAMLGAQNATVGRKFDGQTVEFVDRDLLKIPTSQLPPQLCQATGLPVEGAIIGHRKQGSKNRAIEWLSINSIPLVRSGDDQPYGVLSSFTDVTDRLLKDAQLNSHMDALSSARDELQARQGLLEQANAKLEALAITDGLTGLFNHRAFQERLEQELADLTEPMSLILVDVDHFKTYNDTYGHPEGDRVLRKVANLLRTTVGSLGITARYGGEEFAIILPGKDIPQARAFGDELCRTMADAEWPNRQITISAGVATVTPHHRASSSQLLRTADEALYASKRGGRNQCRHSEEQLRAA